MLNRIIRRRHLPALAGTVLVVAVIGAGTATAASLVTSKDVQDNSLRSVDVKNGSLRVNDLTARAVKTLQKGGVAGATGAKGATGPAGAQGPQGPAAKTGLPNWGVVHRNVEQNGDADLAVQSQTPPLGIGALNLRTGTGADKAAFGNEVDFTGHALSGLTKIGFSVFTTGENISRSSTSSNMPSIAIEVDPTGASSTAPNFSTLVFIPNNSTGNVWSAIDATDPSTGFQGGGWFYTGSAGTASGCNQTTFCTFAQAKAAFPDAVIDSIAVTKGRDFSFSGAVDALVVNAQTFDFEPTGVFLK
jgi:hypothetical protein